MVGGFLRVLRFSPLRNTVKSVHVVTPIKQSPVLRGHLYLVMSYTITYEWNLFSKVTCLIRPHFICPRLWPLNTRLTVLLITDDVVLMANSRDELQKILQISHNFTCKWNLRFNSKKSKVMVIGNNLNKNSNWVLGILTK